MSFTNSYSSLHCNEEFEFDDDNMDEFDNDPGMHLNNNYDANAEDSEEGTILVFKLMKTNMLIYCTIIDTEEASETELPTQPSRIDEPIEIREQ